MRIKGKKTGRNDPCICGSGLKFKRCCGTFVKMKQQKETLEKVLNEAKAKNILQKQQQGLGRPVISTTHQGYRIVAVAGKVCWSKKWTTFFDFLGGYIKNVLDSAWGNKELSKPFEQRHPVIQWYDYVCKQQKESIKIPGRVFAIKPNGATYSYSHLAYNLYLLAHNQPTDQYSQKLQLQIIKRLKKQDQFPGAYYETYVYAILIKAGFSVELENEKDGKSSHCECIITHKNSGKKFTIEAKSIRRNGVLGVTENYTSKDLGGSIRDQIYKSLRKNSEYPRIIFIDVNLPNQIGVGPNDVPRWITEATEVTNRAASNLTIDGNEPDQAYIIFTNHPSHHDLTGASAGCSAVAVGFKINNFGYGSKYSSLIERHAAKQTHLEVEELIRTMEMYQEPPATFEPELSSHKYADDTIVPLKIGHDYCVPDGEGAEVVGALIDAVIMESEKLVYGIYQIKNDNRMIMATSPITDEELEDYKKYPDVFFGVFREQSRKPLKDAYDMFEWLLKTYSSTSKEKLLDFMKGSNDFEELRLKDQKELSLIYCERIAGKMFKK